MGALDGKVAIITGAGTGIGYEAAKMFAAEGAKLVVVGRRAEPLEAVVAEIKAAGGEAVAKPTDLEDGDAAEAIAAFTIETYGRVDILVNNAGHASKVRSIRWVKPDEWESVFKINIDAVYRLTQACLPDMLSRGEGTVITTSSMAALTPGIVGGAPYSAAKAASYNLMRGLNSELREAGIRATAIIPGEVDTPILEGRPAVPPAEARATMMQPEDVASAILLCATMPHRTLIEEIVLLPTQPRDMSEELKVARVKGAPDGQP
jgi:NADP-dependent 3-hydroxy acid dehydrogenase YdfG